jgi:hypothetical protein
MKIFAGVTNLNIGTPFVEQSQLQQELNMQQQSKDAYPDGN